MSKIQKDHLDRAAYVYVRQSSPAQVEQNLESQRRQYGLVERARPLGGGTSASSTRISDGRAAGALSAGGSRGFFPRYVKDKPAPSSPSRRPGLPGTAMTGTGCWSFAKSSIR